ncbi:MAG TPA: aminoacyl-tRNA hydrolase [Candidatus Omnitrophota bacterium]|nr:aminoacyl-tRNA hydrolase [Candidatus Omnitrophota bacterium]HRZ15735.1 aminoacyl-tRNA hydrolase [Candidatus Omnitrophota bacterium]
MKLVIGLGNPGKEYASTRHNIGSLVVAQCARACGVTLKKERWISAVCGKARICGEAALFGIPLTYMNLSGHAVGPLIKRYKIPLSDLLVVYDDLDLEFGALKIKSGGASGGHNGMKSIIAVLGSEEFSRLRIGIGRPAHAGADIADFVLSQFSRKEKETVDETIQTACNGVQAWLEHGVVKSMNMFNR